MAEKEALQQFWSVARSAARAGDLAKLTLSKPRSKGADFPKNLYARLVEIRGGMQLQIAHRFPDREEVKNHPLESGLNQLSAAMGEEFLHADLYTTTEQLSLMMNRKGNTRLIRKTLHRRPGAPKMATPDTDHNREKNRLVHARRPYLRALGITNDQGEVKKEGKRKFKQINKFVEIMDGLLREHPLPSGAHIVDMGSGSGYLTFALYDHLTNTLGLRVKVTGVELRAKLVEKCRKVARECKFTQLHFEEGYIDNFTTTRIDALIALHACDTATDDALHHGMRAGAEIMVVAPCCQKQVRRDMEVPKGLRPLLGNGIILERQAAMLTDGLRALFLEAEGYKTKLFEFIPLEHTAKNVMITAVRGRRREKAREEIRHLKKTFGVTRHHLEDLLSETSPS
ncbi:SAM-dependent methyltransferase [Lewinella sp. W8]|uniref:class I SAM-dependent methyltransferase n=1 Tax=Lewinella sp. W8 TaxID=2528208 RepID=UPI001068B019|nr:SAM-dependent methyltransferase [Lewinella sp. W8]MTB53708.1 methyltransferase [Lewinella sp. W8]